MRIDYLCDHPALVPDLAAAHHAAFAPLLPRWTLAEAQQELRTHRARRTIPTTLLALDDGGDWLGSVSLLANDDERIRAWSPWLASLYVRPEARGRGCGRRLVARLCEEAAALGVATLYLYCEPGLADFYRSLGWRMHAQGRLDAAAVVVMAHEPMTRGTQ